jgi:hypothetical protein
MLIRMVVDMSEVGVVVRRYDSTLVLPELSFEQLAANPKLGVTYSGRSFDQLIQQMKEAAVEATAQEET